MGPGEQAPRPRTGTSSVDRHRIRGQRAYRTLLPHGEEAEEAVGDERLDHQRDESVRKERLLREARCVNIALLGRLVVRTVDGQLRIE